MAQGKRKTHEEFVVEVKALVGDEYTVVGTYVNAATKVEMLHEVCGNINHVSPNSFLCGSKCPICSKNTKKTTNEFKEEVFKIVREEYEVVSEYNNSYSKIDMLHKTCGEIYQVAPSSFLVGNRCSRCIGNIKKTTDEFKEEVFKIVREEYEVVSEYKSALSKINMLHVTCGEVYAVRASNFLSGSRCPKCRESKGEREIAQWLSSNSISFESQAPIRYERGKRPLKLDFLTKNVAIEFDGKQHFEPIDIFGGEEGLRKTQRLDAIKDKYCADNGIPLIRIPYWDFDNIDAILTQKLLPLLKERVS